MLRRERRKNNQLRSFSLPNHHFTPLRLCKKSKGVTWSRGLPCRRSFRLQPFIRRSRHWTSVEATSTALMVHSRNRDGCSTMVLGTLTFNQPWGRGLIAAPFSCQRRATFAYGRDPNSGPAIEEQKLRNWLSHSAERPCFRPVGPEASVLNAKMTHETSGRMLFRSQGRPTPR